MANDKAKTGAAGSKGDEAMASIMASFAAIDARNAEVAAGLNKVAAAVEVNNKSLDQVTATLTKNAADTNGVLDRVALGLGSMGKRDEALLAAQNQLGTKLDGLVNELRATRPEAIDEDRLANGVGNRVAAALQANAWSGKQLFGSALACLMAMALVMFLVLKLSGIGSTGSENIAKSKEEQEAIAKAAADKAVAEANKSRPATVATSFPSLVPLITVVQGQSVHISGLTTASNNMATAINGQTTALKQLVDKMNAQKQPPTADEIAEAIEKRRVAAAAAPSPSPSATVPASPVPGGGSATVTPSDPAATPAPTDAPSVPPSGGDGSFMGKIGSGLRNVGADAATAAKLSNEAAMAKHLGKSYKHDPEKSETTTPDGWKVKTTGPGLELIPPCKDKEKTKSSRSRSSSSSGYSYQKVGTRREDKCKKESASRESTSNDEIVAVFPVGGSEKVAVNLTGYNTGAPFVPQDGGLSINPILDLRRGGRDGAPGATGATGAAGRDGVDAPSGGRGENNGGGNQNGGRGVNNGG